MLGEYGDGEGPLLFVVGGVHGNEPSGIEAARRVLAELERRRPPVRGRLVCLAGNLSALARGERFLDRDLNRIWTRAEVETRRVRGAAPGCAEEREQRELMEAIETRVAAAPGRALFLDLHSTSAAGPPFAILGDTLANREIAFAFGVPVVLGLEENVRGTLLEYYGESGHVAVGLEGGQHGDPTTVDHHESALWVALVASGLLAEDRAPEIGRHRARLANRARGIPRVLEILHRHEVRDPAGFAMEPGFANFHPVEAGRLLARDGPLGRDEVRAESGGVLLMPRYQGQGRDGFFLTRPVRPFWLAVSARLRRLRLERALPLLPGIRRHASDPHVLLVDRRVARWYRRQIFHLLGFRRATEEGDVRVYARRAE